MKPDTTDKRESSKVQIAVGLVMIALIVTGIIWGISALVGKYNDRPRNASKNVTTETRHEANEPTEQTPKDAVPTVDSISKGVGAEAIAGTCSYNAKPKPQEFSTADDAASRATTAFVNIAERVFASGKCDTFQYGLFVDLKDTRGNDQNWNVLTLRVSKDKFSTYRWANMKDQYVGNTLKNDGIITKFNADWGVNLDKIMYKGSQSAAW